MIKYLRLQPIPGSAVNGLLLFPGYLSHADVAAGRPVLSAGFIDPSDWHCFGESDSLGIGTDPGDTARLRSLFPYPAAPVGQLYSEKEITPCA